LEFCLTNSDTGNDGAWTSSTAVELSIVIFRHYPLIWLKLQTIDNRLRSILNSAIAILDDNEDDEDEDDEEVEDAR
jgi:hypothetical protein